jgi:hypothetical protein
MSERLIQFGRIGIEALPRWSFFPLDKLVVARPHSRIGAMKLSLRHADGMPPPRSHIESLRIAQEFLEDPDRSEPHRLEQLSRGSRLVGAADFTTDSSYYRLWYVHEEDCLVSAIYGCKFSRRREHPAVTEVMDCHRMITSLTIAHLSGAASAVTAVPAHDLGEQHA